MPHPSRGEFSESPSIRLLSHTSVTGVDVSAVTDETIVFARLKSLRCQDPLVPPSYALFSFYPSGLPHPIDKNHFS